LECVVVVVEADLFVEDLAVGAVEILVAGVAV